jgi:signal transduction histidine kinase
VLLVNVLFRSYDAAHPDRLLDVVYMWLIAAILSFQEVRLAHGRLTLHGVISGAAVVILNPLDATLIAVAAGVVTGRRAIWPIVANTAVATSINCLAATIAVGLRVNGTLSLSARLLIQAAWITGNLAVMVIAIRISTGESLASIARKNVTPPFVAAFAYFALAAVLVSYVIDGSLLGYFLATIVCVLALALTDTIAGRRVRTVLESELSDADRHLFHSRAVEGVVHNLRNHVATALAYLREIDPRRLESVDRDSLVTATEATNDAVSVLRSLEQGATPKVTYALTPVDLNELAVRAVGMARPRARPKEVQLAVRESAADVKVHADPLLLREVMTNLINNAIEAVDVGGRVDVSTGMRPNGWAFVSVADTGPGVPDEYRHRLFEPHFTTKESGTGLGLFMSYGIVREHQGQLNYEGNRRGAVFTVILPPFVS